jgi:glyoxylate carboligase
VWLYRWGLGRWGSRFSIVAATIHAVYSDIKTVICLRHLLARQHDACRSSNGQTEETAASLGCRLYKTRQTIPTPVLHYTFLIILDLT